MANVTRKNYRKIRLALVALALCMVMTAVPVAVFRFAPTVEAVNVTTWSDLKTQIENTGSGATKTVTITNSITQSGEAAFKAYITVNSGATINLVINKDIAVTMSTDSPWGNAYGKMFLVNSGATLNITGEGTLKMNYDKTGDKSTDKKHEFASNAATLIENNGGTVNVGTQASTTGPTLYSYVRRQYAGVSGDSAGHVFLWATAIWNKTAASKANIYSGNVNAHAEGTCASDKTDWTGNDKDGAGVRCFTWAYGVLDGTVTMNGGSIDVFTECQFNAYDNLWNARRTFGGSLAYGILSDNVTMINGNIHTKAQYDANAKAVCDDAINGSLAAWSVGLGYWTAGKYPVLEGGQISTEIYDNEGMDNWKSDKRGDQGDYCNITYAVAQTPAKSLIKYEPSNYSVSEIKKGDTKKFWDLYGSETKEFRWKASGSSTENNNYLSVRSGYSGYPSAGYAKDYNNRTSAQLTSASSLYGGDGTAAKTKTLYAYRYYTYNTTTKKYALNKVQAGADTSINAAITSFTNILADGDRTTTATTFGASMGGGMPVNTYKWELKNIHYYTYKPSSFTVTVPQDSILKTSFSGDQTTTVGSFDTTGSLRRFRYFGATHTRTQMANTTLTQACDGTRVYVFFDYYEQPVENLTFTPLANGSFEYDATALTKAELHLTAASGGVLVGDRTVTNTSGYPQTNLMTATFDGSTTNENNMTYTYSGTRADGATISSTSGLPKDAGTWTVAYSLPASATTNRAKLEGTFGVTITQTTPGFEDLTYTITYSSALSAIDLAAEAQAKVDAFVGDFDFAWAKGGDYLPVVAESGSNFTVTATPKSDKAFNYSVASDDFTVKLTVNPLKVNVTLATTSVTYGNDFSASGAISAKAAGNTPAGAVANNASVTGTLLTELRTAASGLVQVKSGDTAIAYTAGTTRAGSYSLVLSQTSGRIGTSNFSINAVTNGALTVNKRELTVTVGPQGPGNTVYVTTYDPDKTSGAYTFSAGDVSGAYGRDAYGTDYAINNVNYKYPNGGKAGTGAVSLASGASVTLAGPKADCYTIKTVNYRTMTINKADPPYGDYTLPSLSAVTYDPLTTIGDIATANASKMTDAKGYQFAPKTAAEVPVVTKSSYTFVCTPPDSDNYNTVEVAVPLKVNKRTVTVRGELRDGTSIVYGSSAPVASDYKWTFSGWTAKSGSNYPTLVDNGGVIATGGVGTLAGLSANYNQITLTSEYTPATNAGTTVTVKVNGAFGLTADNYTFSFSGKTFTVAKRGLTLKAPNVTAGYGEMPAADASGVEYDGFVNGDTVASVFGTQQVQFKYVKTNSYSGAAFTPYTDGVGSYYVFAYYSNDGSLTNYAVKRTSGVLTVTPKEVWLVPTNMTIKYADDAPTAFTYVPQDSGIQASDVFSGSVAATTNYTKGKDTGTYQITTTCNADGTYTAAQQPNLTVNANYTVKLGSSAILTVEKATIPASTVQTAINKLGTLTYTYDPNTTLETQQRNASMVDLSFTYKGITVNGAISYERGAEIINVSDSGAFTVQFAPSGANADNFNVVNTGLTGQVKVNKAQVSGTLQLSGQLMITGNVYPDLSGVNPSNVDLFTYKWVITDTNETVSQKRNLYIEEKDESKFLGKTITLTVTARTNADNYYGSLTLVTDPVSAKLPALPANYITTSFTDSVTYTYNANQRKVTVTVASAANYKGAITVKYNGETTPPTDVGSYIVTYDATTDGKYAATYAALIGTMTINPKQVTVSFGAQDKVYDGTTKATFDSANPLKIASGVYAKDSDKVELNTRNARIAFTNVNAGSRTVSLSSVYLTGDKAANYTLADATATAKITKAPVTASAALRTPIVDYSADLATASKSGLTVYFYNITGVMSRDRSTFRIADDTAVAVKNPAGGKTCYIDMSTVNAVANNSNYTVTILTTQLPITVNKIAPVTVDSLGALKLDSRVYDSKTRLTDAELRTYISKLDGGKYKNEAKYYSWVRTGGVTPIPEVSNTGDSKQYAVLYNNTDNTNYKTATIRVSVPVTPRPVVLTANSYTTNNGNAIKYGAAVPTLSYTVSARTDANPNQGLYAGETLKGVFNAEPTLSTNYVRYANVGTYTISVNAALLRNANYTVTTVPGSINVTKVALTTTATAENKTYDGKNNNIQIHFSELKGVVRNSDDVYLPASVTGLIASADAGNNKLVTFTAPTLQGTAAGNYTLTVTNKNSLRVNVSKAKLDASAYSFPFSATITYGQTLGEAVLEGGSGDGTFAYVLSGDTPSRVGVFNDYEMRFVPKNSVNYETVVRKVPLTVSTAYLLVEPVISGSNYVGNILTVNIPNVPSAALQYATFTWYRVDANGARVELNETGTTYQTSAGDVGYYIGVTVTFSPDSPYQPNDNSVSEALSSLIREVQQSFWQRLFGWWAKLIKAIQSLFRR